MLTAVITVIAQNIRNYNLIVFLYQIPSSIQIGDTSTIILYLTKNIIYFYAKIDNT